MALRRVLVTLTVAALAAPLAALLLFRLVPSTDPMWMQMDVHFWIV